ncbi:hypothetical protein H257_13486 [Aphanomyces astaci]|uniref:Uncharacterized protein n=1 Tax=Aphanomyces astaci TaxID=112090 RepID=W4FUB7_APHAT|nr:hypothetical protein H257_13486 [Aphanomyces astaci]ETV71067.1 hypothetical protein H257_13486 [Aphanomyces astaci]|eukprot:XP_009839313.1 hypothetical protein H257_13486 [Aphanomyces astaci]
MAAWYLMNGNRLWVHRALLCAMYIACGVRFMFGWVKRGHVTKEDHRWNHSKVIGRHPAEYVGAGLWLFGFVFENIADAQLRVMRQGLWKYYRHPNYFGEFYLWLSYAIMSFADASPIQRALLVMLPGQVSLKKRGQAYADYQAETSILFPWWPKSKSEKRT